MCGRRPNNNAARWWENAPTNTGGWVEKEGFSPRGGTTHHAGGRLARGKTRGGPTARLWLGERNHTPRGVFLREGPLKGGQTVGPRFAEDNARGVLEKVCFKNRGGPVFPKVFPPKQRVGPLGFWGNSPRGVNRRKNSPCFREGPIRGRQSLGGFRIGGFQRLARALGKSPLAILQTQPWRQSLFPGSRYRRKPFPRLKTLPRGITRLTVNPEDFSYSGYSRNPLCKTANRPSAI